ncbi:MAG TPA: cytochrome c [Chitinophagaceae bacterium]|nr:cytochrome c [Chitinophagaceae bacterium]
MKKLLVLSIIAFGIAACGGNGSGEKKGTSSEPSKTETGNPSYDPNRGAGKFTKVEVSPTLEVAKADAGEKVFSVKCAACHKLTEEKLVGPGWKGVTDRHTAEWIMNFSTNPEEMLNKDPKAQAMLEICLVRMPNQNLSDDDARNVYEFMRKNDGVK